MLLLFIGNPFENKDIIIKILPNVTMAADRNYGSLGHVDLIMEKQKCHHYDTLDTYRNIFN